MKQMGVAVWDPRPAFNRHPRPESLFYVVTGLHVSKEGAELLSNEVLNAILSLPET